MNRKNVDIAIITRNRDESLLRCITHILLNSMLPKRIIIVHSQKPSRCTTKLQIMQLGVQFRVPIIYKHIKHKGVSYSRNIALSLVTSDLFAFIDDDEIPPQNWIKKAVSFLAKHPNISVVFGPKLPNIPDNYWNGVWKCIYHLDKPSTITDFATSSNAFYRTRVFKKYHLQYDIRFATSSEDFVMSFQLQKAGAMIFFHSRLYVSHDFRTTMKGFSQQWFDYGITAHRYYQIYHHLESFRGNAATLWYFFRGIRSIHGNTSYIPGLLLCDVSFAAGYLYSWFI